MDARDEAESWIELGSRATGRLGPGDQRHDGSYADYWDFDMPASGTVQIDTRYAIWGPVRDDLRQGIADGWTWVRKRIGEEEQRAFLHPKTHDLFSEQDLTDMLLEALQRRRSTEADSAAVLESIHGLLRAGAKAEARDEEGRTPLHWAAMRQAGSDVVKALVDAGAVPGAKDGAGRTALDHAEGRRESEIVAVLRELVPAAVEVEELAPAAAQVSEPRVKPVETEVVPEPTARPAVLRESESPEPRASEPRAAAPVATESPVSVLPAAELGLYDVHGNVWEWVEDCWHDSYVGAPTDGSAWTASGDCGRRVMRGGGWADPPRVLTAAYRRWFRENDREFHYGFRVARTLD